MNVKYLQPDGSVKEKEAMMNSTADDGSDPDRKHLGTWLARHNFNAAMFDHLCEHHSNDVKVAASPCPGGPRPCIYARLHELCCVSAQVGRRVPRGAAWGIALARQ